jgi:hypothetical protein
VSFFCGEHEISFAQKKISMIESIRRNIALREYDIKETPQGKQTVFSIKFIKKNGEMVFLPRAVASGLSFSVKDNRMRGVVAVDDWGNKIGHVYPVNIDLLIEWNGKQIVL